HVDEVRLLIGYEGSSFSSLNEFESDILSITSVHPMREDAVRKLLERKGKKWDSMERLLEKNAIKRVDYEGRSFYLRNFEQI
ncbi:MAG: radical SAM protein, partial [Candidatus Thermoplasmatota archaeon]|nr:radical SAM protein [Candidatus Thermoplasmatota archaeon]